MIENLTAVKNSGTSKIVLLLSVLASGFWWLASSIDVYRYAFTGAIFELLSLTTLALLFSLPIISLIFLVKEKVYARTYYLVSLLIVIPTILFMLFSK